MGRSLPCTEFISQSTLCSLSLSLCRSFSRSESQWRTSPLRALYASKRAHAEAGTRRCDEEEEARALIEVAGCVVCGDGGGSGSNSNRAVTKIEPRATPAPIDNHSLLQKKKKKRGHTSSSIPGWQ